MGIYTTEESPKRVFRKAFITGLTGSGGSYLADYILEHHPEVEVHGTGRSTTRSNIAHIRDKVRVHGCDLTDLFTVIAVLFEVRPDVIFHLASDANVRKSFDTPLDVLQNNVMGTANLLEAIRFLNSVVKFDPVVQICSTSEVYGQVDPKNVPITEECPLSPSSPYAVSKMTQDFLGYTYFKSYGMKIIRTRMFSYVNPRRADLFATSFARQVALIEVGKQKALAHGNLDSVRTMIDARDAMEAYWVAVEKCRFGEVYNMGGNTVITVGEFLELLKKHAKCEIPSYVDPALLRPADVTLQIPDVTKFTTETGWTPKRSFEESVSWLLEHCRRDVSLQ